MRAAGISAEIYPDAAKMKKQMGRADALHARFTAIVGDNELANPGTLTLKDMATGEQSTVTVAEAITRITL